MRQCALVIFLMALCLVPVLAGAVGAKGTDLVFLIDQSGSMMGKGATSVANDPDAKRIDALYALDQPLVDSAVAGMTNRLSVIEFGGRNARYAQSRPQVTLSRLEIPPLPPGGDPSAVRRQIRDNLHQVKSVFRGDTDHAAALQLAAEEIRYFHDNPPAIPVGGQPGPRNQVVVLITDGASYAKGVSLPRLKSEIETQTQDLAQHAQLVLTVFGLNDASDYWRRGWGEFWEHLATKDPQTNAGRAYLLFDAREAIPKVLQVVSEFIAGIEEALVGPVERYVVPAYLRALDFSINFHVPSLLPADIDIRDPAGKRIAVTPGVSRGYASASVPYPQPGQWTLKPAGARYDVIPTPGYETAKLVEPLGPVAQGSQVAIRYQLSGRGPNGLFQAQPGLPAVRFELTLESPTGQRQNVPVQEDGTGYVSSQGDVLLNEVGTYTLEFKGETLAIDGNYHTVYKSSRANGNTILINPATPLELRLEAPTSETPITLFNGATQVPVRLRFYNRRTHTPLKAHEVLKSGVTLQVTYRLEGQPAETPSPSGISLQVTEQGLEAQLPVDLGRTRWDYLWGEAGVIRLQVSPDNFWRSEFRFLGINGDLQHYLLSPPLQVTESWWSLWPGLILLVILSGLGWLWRYVGRAWLISWRDRHFEQAPKLVFKVVQDPNLSKTWSLKGISQLKPANTRVDLDLQTGETWAIQKLNIVRLTTQGKEVAIKLTYQPRPAKMPKVKVKLRARDDSGQYTARHRVEGLEVDKESVFVLLVGEKKTA